MSDTNKNYDKIKKADLVAMLDDAEKSLKTAKVALDGLKADYDAVVNERDNFKVIADNAEKIVGDATKKLNKAVNDLAERQKVIDGYEAKISEAKGKVSKAQKAADANKLLVEDLQSKCQLLDSMLKRQAEEYDKRIADLQAAIKSLERPWWKRIFG